MFDKKRLYETHGVREYGIVDEAYTVHRRCVENGTAASALLETLAIELETLF